MVKDIWAICNWCYSHVNDETNIHVLVCLCCDKNIKDNFYHKLCVNIIYDKTTCTFYDELKKFLEKVQCKNCLCEQFKINCYKS